MIELKNSSGQPEKGMQPKNNNNNKPQMFVILLLASMWAGEIWPFFDFDDLP